MATLPIQTEIDELAEGLTFMPMVFSRNNSLHVIDAADTNLASRAGLKYFLEIQIPEYKYFGDFVALHRSEGREVPIEANPNGSVYEGCRFLYNEKNGKLDGCLDWTKPQRGSTKMMTVVSQTMQFRLREIVQQDDPEVDTDTLKPAKWLIKAGLHPIDYERYAESFFSSYQATRLKFLTWQPDKLRIGKEERWLSFLLNFSPRPTSVKLRVRLHSFTNELEVQTKDTIKIGNFGQIVMAPVGYEQLGINPETTKFYEVWLSNQDGERISEVRTFYIDPMVRKTTKAITFVNQLGGWDTVRFTGISIENLKTTKTRAERNRVLNTGIEYVDGFIIDIDGEEELTISSIFENDALAHQKHITSLLFSERVYLQTEKGHHYLELLTNSIEKVRDRPDLIAYELKFRKSGVIQNYSDLEQGFTISERPTSWRGIDYKHVLNAFGKRTGRVIPQRLEKYYEDDNTTYKPYTVKANVVGTDGYIEEETLPNAGAIAGTTPYPNVEINRIGKFIRAACSGGGTPGAATIIVTAGKYGGEKAGDADILAEAEAAAMDTQAYADTYGACYPDPWAYVIAVPANKAHFRINTSKSPGVEVSHNYVVKSDATYSVEKGNAWYLQLDKAGQVDVYIPGTWEIQLPTNFATDRPWRFGVYGPNANVRIYVNGVQVLTGSNSGEGFVEYSLAHNLIPSQAKVYIQIF